MTAPKPPAGTGRTSRRQYLTRAAEIATIIATVVALVPFGHWLLTRGSDAGRPAARGGGASPPATPATTSAAPPGPAGRTVYLDTLTPDTGGTNRGPLPHALDGQPGYEHALVIPCATNQAADKFRSLTYLLNDHYASLHATFKPYLNVSDESLVELQLFVDKQPPVGPAVAVNTTANVDVDVYGRSTIELRVTCESPDATAILSGAYLQHR